MLLWFIKNVSEVQESVILIFKINKFNKWLAFNLNYEVFENYYKFLYKLLLNLIEVF